MSIEWKRVTWYSQIVAIILFVLVFIFGFYIGRRYEWKLENGDANPQVTIPN